MTDGGADIGRSNCRHESAVVFKFVDVQSCTLASVKERDSVCVMFFDNVFPFLTNDLFIVIYKYYKKKIIHEQLNANKFKIIMQKVIKNSTEIQI